MAKKRNYPANLLHAMKFNQFMETDIDYENMTEDQKKALSVMMQNHLTERENHIVKMLYVQGMSRKEIAEEYELPENRIRQIVDKALRKLRKKEWLLYVVDGYDAHLRVLQEQIFIEEIKYCGHIGIEGKPHVLYQSVDSLGVSKRVLYSIKKGGCESIRDVIVSLGIAPAHRKYGEVAALRICEDLKSKKLLPENYVPIKWQLHAPLPDIEVAVFHHINSFFPE